MIVTVRESEFWILEKYYEIFDSRELEEIQVRNEDEVIIGDTRFVRPFMIRYAPKSMHTDSRSAASDAISMMKKSKA